MPESVLAAPLEWRTRIFIIVLSLGVLGFVINMVRTRRLREEYALLWIVTGIVLVLAPLSIDLLDQMSYAIGVDYPPALLFLIALLCILFILFQFSLVISRFADQIKVLTQELAITRARMEELEKRLLARQEQGS